MQITLDVTALRTGLKKVQPATKSRSTLPILSCLLLTVEHNPDRLTLRATDLTVDVQCSVPAAISPDLYPYPFATGQACPPVKLFSEIVSDFKAGVVQIAYDPYTQRTTVQRPDASSKYLIESLPPEEFPSGIEADSIFEEFMVAEDLLQEALGRALLHVAPPDDGSRAAMQGVRFTVEDMFLGSGSERGEKFLALHSTNGRSLWAEMIPLMSSTPRPSMRPNPQQPLSFVLHSAALRGAIPSMIGAVRVRASDNRVGFMSAAGTSSMQKLEGSFPEIERVLDFDAPHVLEINRENLLAAITRAVRCARDEKSPNLLEFGLSQDLVTISSHTASTGTGWERLDCSWSGPEIRLGLNAAYLRACLEGYSGEKVQVCGQPTGTADRAWAVIDPEDEDRRAVFMPVRLRDAVPEPAAV